MTTPGFAVIAALWLMPVTPPDQGALDAEDAGWNVTPQFGDRVRPNDAIAFQLDRPLPPTAGRLAVVIGQTDWSGLFEATGSGAIYRPTTVPLPVGEHEVVVYLVSSDEDWQPVGRFPLRVVQGNVRSQDSMSPTFDVANKGQVTARHQPSTSAPPRRTFQDFTLNAGLKTSTAIRGGWTARTEVQLLGVSNRQEALRFGQSPTTAPLVDLVGYTIGIESRHVAITLGSVSFGASRHLFNDFASRGVLTRVRLGSRADVALAALHGSTMVGWSNVLGVEDRMHRVVGATVGLELLARPGGLRFETSLLDGALRPLTAPNERKIDDAEESRGGSVRVVASDARQRFRLDGAYARSSFTNPADPLLAQGADLVPVMEETRDARYLDLTYALVQKTIGKSTQANLVATYRHERVDPLYRSVVADLRSDVLQNAIELGGSLGPASAQISYTRLGDNLGRIDSIVTTATSVTQLTAALPLGSLWTRAGRESSRWPSLTYALSRIHQRGLGVPVNAGFSSAAQLPDQAASDQSLGLEWQGVEVRAGYRVNRSIQDNRQTGKEESDLANLVHTATFGVAAGARVDLQLDLALEAARNRELAMTSLTHRLGLGGNWRPTSLTILSGQVSANLLGDSTRNGQGRDTEISLQLSQTVRLSRQPTGTRRGQFFVRYARQSSRRLDRLFAIDTTRLLSTFHTGFNVSLF